MFMFALSNQAGGKTMGFPDVCKTPAPPAPPIPVPYPNMSMTETANALTCALKVRIIGMSAFTMKTQWMMSMGDEPGVGGGIISGRNMADVGFVMGSLKVLIEGAPAVFQTSPTKHNGSNPNMPMGSTLMAPQFIVDITM